MDYWISICKNNVEIVFDTSFKWSSCFDLFNCSNVDSILGKKSKNIVEDSFSSIDNDKASSYCPKNYIHHHGNFTFQWERGTYCPPEFVFKSDFDKVLDFLSLLSIISQNLICFAFFILFYRLAKNFYYSRSIWIWICQFHLLLIT